MAQVPVVRGLLVRFVKPLRNSERNAIRRFGDIWCVTNPGGIFHRDGMPGLGVAIQSGTDERWVSPDQITAAQDQHGNPVILAPGERWETGKVAMLKV
jgi:hypothetical protein